MQVTFMIQPTIPGEEGTCERVYGAWIDSMKHGLKLKTWTPDMGPRATDTISDDGNVEHDGDLLTSRVWVHVDHTRALEVVEGLRLLWADKARRHALSLFNVFFILYNEDVDAGMRAKMETICSKLAADIIRNDDDWKYDNIEFVCYKQHQLEACVAAFLGIAAA